MKIRTRFAPSPTGLMHIGNVRTALYAWLYARKMKGEFILRIEDTDLERSRQDCIEVILDGLKWLGLDYDEGPIYQTKRFERYNEILNKLLEEGHAYRCYCTKERLDELRQKQTENKEKPRYDGHCRDLKTTKKDVPHVIRFRNPQEGSVCFEDKVLGNIEIKNQELDDLIIARTDGSPTYNFTVVVDDLDLDITHVIRGADHVNNTPRQINIMKALGAEIPIYAHLPMILADDGKRLSKRHGTLGILEYQKNGFLPEALLNYIVRLGWSHGDQEIFSIDEMIELFELEKLNKAAASFNTDKLLWLNQHYLKTLPVPKVTSYLKTYMQDNNVIFSDTPPLDEVVKIQTERCKTLKEIAEKSSYFYEEFTEYEEKAANKNLKQDTAKILKYLIAEFAKVEDWKAPLLHQVVIDTAEMFGLKLGKVAQPIRVAITGDTISPPIDITLELIGRERTLQHLHNAVLFCEKTD